MRKKKKKKKKKKKSGRMKNYVRNAVVFFVQTGTVEPPLNTFQ